MNPEFDPLSPAFLTDPYPVYADLRTSTPIFWSERVNSWIVTEYKACDEILRDWQAFGSDYRRAGRHEAPEMVSIQTTDPTEHTALRAALADGMRDIHSDALMAMPAERLREIVLARRGSEVDLVAEVLQPFSTAVLEAVLGLDLFDTEAVRWSEAVVRSMFAGLEPESHDDGLAARRQLSAALATAVDNAKSGVFAKLRGHAAAGDTLINSIRVLMLAVMNSGARAAGLAALTALRSDSGLAGFTTPIDTRVCHELVRFDGPFQATSRIAVTDTTIGGVTIRRGDEVTLFIGSANRDPSAFTTPDRLCHQRSPNRHLAFGVGIHYCLGAAIGIQLIATFLEVLRELARDSEMVGEPVFDRNPTLRGVTSLRVRLA